MTIGAGDATEPEPEPEAMARPRTSTRDREALRTRLEAWLAGRHGDRTPWVHEIAAPEGTGMSSETVLKKKGDLAVHFLAAEMNALHYALGHKAETVALTRKIIHAKPNDPRPGFVFDEAVRLHMVDPTLSLPLDKFNWLQGLLVKTGKLKKPVDLKTVVAPQYREKALKLAGS